MVGHQNDLRQDVARADGLQIALSKGRLRRRMEQRLLAGHNEDVRIAQESANTPLLGDSCLALSLNSRNEPALETVEGAKLLGEVLEDIRGAAAHPAVDFVIIGQLLLLRRDAVFPFRQNVQDLIARIADVDPTLHYRAVRLVEEGERV